jgi:hypothetical protein
MKMSIEALRTTQRKLTRFGLALVKAQQERSGRDKKRFTWTRLARESGTSTTHISYCLYGDRSPTRETIGKWVDALSPSQKIVKALYESAGYIVPHQEEGET